MRSQVFIQTKLVSENYRGMSGMMQRQGSGRLTLLSSRHQGSSRQSMYDNELGRIEEEHSRIYEDDESHEMFNERLT